MGGEDKIWIVDRGGRLGWVRKGCGLSTVGVGRGRTDLTRFG